ncbi:unnamed protein product [Closterium sp. Yama58-4]|nr:unnamed protein product [Closterium sp. Yama58-4]
MTTIPLTRFSLSVLLIVALLEIAAHPATVSARKDGGGSRRQPPPPDLDPTAEIFPTCKFSGGINLTVSPKFVGTTWRGWGTSLAWFANYVGGLPQKTQNKILDLLFGKDNLGLNIVRYNIGGGNNKNRSRQFYQTQPTDWRGMPGYKPTENGPYDWSADERQRNVLQGAKQRGANVFEAFSNSPPWWMTKSGDVAGPRLIGQSNLKQEYEGAFANYLTTVVEHFAKNWGVTFDTLEPFNEAMEGFWQAGNKNEGCSFDAPAMGRIIKYTSDSLKKKGLKTKLVGADSWSESTAKLPQVPNHQLLSRINVHSYMNRYQGSDIAKIYETSFGSVRDAAKQLGKDVWVSEAGPLSQSGSLWDVSLYMARNIIESVNIMEASAYVYWQAYDTGGWSMIDFPSSYRPGYSGSMKSPTPNKRFWLFKHLTTLVKPGIKPLKVGLDCAHGIAAFYSPGEKRVTVFIVNQQATERKVKINLQALGIAAHPASVTAKTSRGGHPRKPPPPNLSPSSEIFPTCKFSGGINFTVSPNFVGTTWRGWGTSLAWFANYVGGLPQKTQNQMLDLLFGKDNLNLNILRYNIGGGHDKKRSPQFYQMQQTDYRGMPGYKPTEKGPYDWTADERQRSVLQGAKQRGANVFEAFSNSPPWWMTKSGDVAGPPLIGQSNLKPEYESAFANYLTTVVEQFAKKWGVTFDTLEPFNEAMEGFWQKGMAHEGCSFDPPAMGRVIKYTSDSLKKKGLKTKLVGADSWSRATARLSQVANHQLLSRINVHSYMNTYENSDVPKTYEDRFGGVRDLAKQLGKDVWVSEAGPASKGGSPWDVSLYIARNIIESVNIMEASAYVYWQAYDTGYGWSMIDFPSSYRPGYSGAMKTPKPNKRFWLFRHFTMLAKPGSKPIKIVSALLSASFRASHARALHRDSIRPASTAGAAGRYSLDEITLHARMRRERRNRNVRLFSVEESASLSPPPSLQPISELFDTCSFPGPISLNITPSFIGTTWKGWGTSLAWQGNYIGGFPKDRMDTLLDLVFHPTKGLGMNIVRYNIGGGHNDTLSPQFSKDVETSWKAMPGYWPAESGPYDWNADQRQRNVLFGARERGANIFEAFSNSPPWWMTVSGDVAGASEKNQPNLKPQYEGKFVDYLTTVVEKFAKDPAWNLTFDTLEPFNEPLENFWTARNGQEGCNFEVPGITRVLWATLDALKKKGLQTKVAAFDSWTEDSVSAINSIARINEVKRINVHGYMDPAPSNQDPVSYTTQTYSKMRDIAKGMGKEVWVSESGPMGRFGQPFDLSLYMARNVIETVNILQASAYVYWLTYDSDPRWAMIHFPWNYPAGQEASRSRSPRSALTVSRDSSTRRTR